MKPTKDDMRPDRAGRSVLRRLRPGPNNEEDDGDSDAQNAKDERSPYWSCAWHLPSDYGRNSRAGKSRSFRPDSTGANGDNTDQILRFLCFLLFKALAASGYPSLLKMSVSNSPSGSLSRILRPS